MARATGAKSVPRTAREQYKQGEPVTSEPRPGDLLFWEGTQKNLPGGVASHVVVYIGNGRIAQAGSRGVYVSELHGYKPTRNARFLGIRRFSK